MACASSPWVTAFIRLACFPASVFGPVDWCALPRFASIFFSLIDRTVDMVYLQLCASPRMG
jgi:hypothetical protein